MNKKEKMIEESRIAYAKQLAKAYSVYKDKNLLKKRIKEVYSKQLAELVYSFWLELKAKESDIDKETK